MRGRRGRGTRTPCAGRQSAGRPAHPSARRASAQGRNPRSRPPGERMKYAENRSAICCPTPLRSLRFRNWIASARARSSLTNIAKSPPPTWAAVALWVSIAACAPSASTDRSTDRTRRRGRRDGIVVISRSSRTTAALSPVASSGPSADLALLPRGNLLPFPSRPPAVGAAKARRVTASSMNAPTGQTKIFQRIFATPVTVACTFVEQNLSTILHRFYLRNFLKSSGFFPDLFDAFYTYVLVCADWVAYINCIRKDGLPRAEIPRCEREAKWSIETRISFELILSARGFLACSGSGMPG